LATVQETSPDAGRIIRSSNLFAMPTNIDGDSAAVPDPLSLGTRLVAGDSNPRPSERAAHEDMLHTPPNARSARSRIGEDRPEGL